MSIFGSIMSAVGLGGAETTTETTDTTQQESSGSSSGSTTAASSGGEVDVEAVLTELESQNSQELNWRTSIVDLMKLLNLDSSLSNRKELAHELHYTGDTNDSASMNIWLHKQVMQKLAENGGKVPEDLKA